MTQQELEREARRILEGFPGQVVDSRLVDRMAFALSAAKEDGFNEGIEAAAKEIESWEYVDGGRVEMARRMRLLRRQVKG